MPFFGKKRGVERRREKTVMKKKVNENSRERLLVDWGDKDTEKQEKKVKRTREEPTRREYLYDVEADDSTASSDPIALKAKKNSWFKFGEKADAILDNQIWEEVKSIIETGKVHRLTENKIDKTSDGATLVSPKRMHSNHVLIRPSSPDQLTVNKSGKGMQQSLTMNTLPPYSNDLFILMTSDQEVILCIKAHWGTVFKTITPDQMKAFTTKQNIESKLTVQRKIKHMERKSVVQVPKPGRSVTNSFACMQPLQPEITVAPVIQHGILDPTFNLAIQELTQVMYSTPGDHATDSYVLLTTDESEQLVQDSGAHMLYLNRANGGLETQALTVNNPNSYQDILAAAHASRTQVPEEYTDIDTSLNQPTSNETSPPSYSITVENRPEVITIQDPVSEAQDAFFNEVAPDQGVRMPYDRVVSTAQLLENYSVNTAVQPPSDTTNLQSYSETPESTYSVPAEVIQDKSSDVRELGYFEAPESSCIPESSSQVPESTSHSKPLQSDEQGEHSGLKRCGSPLAHKMGLSKRMKHQGNERREDQTLFPRPLLSPALQEEGIHSNDDSLPAFFPPTPPPDKKVFKKNDIVWMKVEELYWPSVVTDVNRKQRKAKVKVVNSPRREKAFVKRFGVLVDFLNSDRNLRLLKEGRQQNIGVQKAFDDVKAFMSEQYAQDNALCAARFLTFDKDDILYGLVRKKTSSDGIPATSQDVASTSTDRKCTASDSPDESINELSDHSEESEDEESEDEESEDEESEDEESEDEESEDEEVSPSKLLEMEEERMFDRSPGEFPTNEERVERDALARQVLEIVKGPDCHRYLTSVFHEMAPSAHHELFLKTGYSSKDSLLYMCGVGPVADTTLCSDLIAVLEDYLTRIDPESKIENKGSKNDYIFYVMMPEAIIFALQHIKNIDKNAACVMFKKMSAEPP